VYGGNKSRKLEFVLGNALARGKKTLVTGGALGTNHGLATALFGRELGFRVVLGLVDQPVTAHVRRNLRLYHACGAETVYVGSIPKALLRYFVIDRIRRRGAFFIPPGASSPEGTLGYVDAALELAMQVDRREMPLPSAIFVPVGSAGTMAGLVLGLRLAGLSTRVIGVRVAHAPFAGPRAVLRLARSTAKLMRRNDRSVPPLRLSLPEITVDGDQYGPGYGHPTVPAREAISLMQDAEGIPLEVTYSGKTFAALLHAIKGNSAEGPVLFWNTFNSVDLSAMAEAIKIDSLPRAFRGFFEGEAVA
jgi:D-cysteine desulfhydrase